MHVASHDLFNMKLRTCLDTGVSCHIRNHRGLYEYDKGAKEDGLGF